MSIASDTYGASLLDVIGVGNVFADSFDRYPEVSLAEVAARRAEPRHPSERAL